MIADEAINVAIDVMSGRLRTEEDKISAISVLSVVRDYYAGVIEERNELKIALEEWKQIARNYKELLAKC